MKIPPPRHPRQLEAVLALVGALHPRLDFRTMEPALELRLSRRPRRLSLTEIPGIDEKVSRRDVLQRSAAFGVLSVVGAGACSKEAPKLSCADTTSLSAGDAQVRVALGYVDTSNQPGKDCVGCQQYLPGADDACGGCKVLRGPHQPPRLLQVVRGQSHVTHGARAVASAVPQPGRQVARAFDRA